MGPGVTPIRGIRSSLAGHDRRRLAAMAAAVAILHVLGWGLLLVAVSGHYRLGTGVFGLGTGVLAYTLGLRHAFDADHISAIDNTTRKLMSEGKRPLSVGFWFSLGHSSIVFVLALALSFGIKVLESEIRRPYSSLHHYTGLVGTVVSGSFLYLIAGLNLIVLVSIVRLFAAMRHGRCDEEQMEAALQNRGLMSRFFGPLSRRVDAPWKMLPVGALFGLGFDTASEVALLVLAGTAVSTNLPVYAVLSLPLLFAAGMSLLDSADGAFMTLAYGWAFLRPARKVFYNLTITGLSVLVAVGVGTVELVSVLSSQLHLTGGIWSWTSGFNINAAGFVIVGAFAVTWLVALAVWHLGGLERRWEAGQAAPSGRQVEIPPPLEGEAAG